jgi:hypothetical protein
MIRIVMLGLTAAAVFTVGGCASDQPVTSFDFETDSQGWIAGFADYPEDGDPALFELDSSWEPLPSDLEGNALFIQGHNRSDDLFMYWKTPIHGLEPDTTYSVEIVVELATAVPGGLMGIGGSPGESVWIKTGASTIEPMAETDDQGWLRMNVDIGSQSEGGDDAVVVGTIANPNLEPGTVDGSRYALMTLDGSGLGLTGRTDDSGTLWVFVGSDSGFEGLTALYYASIDIRVDIEP